MPKIFLAGPTTGDPELLHYLFVAAHQRVAAAHREARIFNPVEDLDAEPLAEIAAVTGFNLSDPADRRRLIFSEFLECSHVYFLPGWEQDAFCAETLRPLAGELEMEIAEL